MTMRDAIQQFRAYGDRMARFYPHHEVDCRRNCEEDRGPNRSEACKRLRKSACTERFNDH
jgi:hypothetical protein